MSKFVEWIPLSGLIDYHNAIRLMEQRLSDVIEEKKDEAIFLLEHQDVFTAGTSHHKDELINNNKIPVIYSDRGGKFTYHGPGQRTIYPILDLKKPQRQKDIKLYIKNLEQWIINSLLRVGLKAYTIKDMVGIWVDSDNIPAKIGAIGIRIRKWVTYHGVAVNVSTNLENYSGIMPCGINNFPVTSLNKLGVKIDMRTFDYILQKEFKKVF